MDFSHMCRTCLSSESLNPIFDDTSDPGRYSAAIYLSAGVKVEADDGLPQNMCAACISMLNRHLEFRRRCKSVERHLVDLKNNGVKRECITMVVKVEQKENENEVSEAVEDIPEVKIKTEYIEPSDDRVDDDEYVDQSSDHGDDVPLVDYLEINHSGYDSENVSNEAQTDTKLYDTVEGTSGKNQRVVCKLCMKELSIRSVDRHMTKCHPGADERRIKCDLCDVHLLRSVMDRHRTTVHGEQGIRCAYCKNEFESTEALLEHVTTCAERLRKKKVPDSSREVGECEICHKSMQRGSLRLHKMIKHAGQGPVCEHCGKLFGNRNRLIEHCRAKHGYEKLKCSDCEFECAAAVAMRNHERRHRGEKPFSCDTCGRKFHASYLLLQHKQSHRTDKLYKCEQCPGSFKSSSRLNMHRMTCHSSDHYKCIMCNRAYSCRSYTVKHLRKFHQYFGAVPRLQRVPAQDDC